MHHVSAKPPPIHILSVTRYTVDDASLFSYKTKKVEENETSVHKNTLRVIYMGGQADHT